MYSGKVVKVDKIDFNMVLNIFSALAGAKFLDVSAKINTDFIEQRGTLAQKNLQLYYRNAEAFMWLESRF